MPNGAWSSATTGTLNICSLQMMQSHQHTNTKIVLFFYSWYLMFLALTNLIRKVLWRNMGVTKVFCTSLLRNRTCSRWYIWKKNQSWWLTLHTMLCVGDQPNPGFAFLPTLARGTDWPCSVCLSSAFTPGCQDENVFKLWTSCWVQGWRCPNIEVNTPKHIIGLVMTAWKPDTL